MPKPICWFDNFLVLTNCVIDLDHILSERRDLPSPFSPWPIKSKKNWPSAVPLFNPLRANRTKSSNTCFFSLDFFSHHSNLFSPSFWFFVSFSFRKNIFSEYCWSYLGLNLLWSQLNFLLEVNSETNYFKKK